MGGLQWRQDGVLGCSSCQKAEADGAADCTISLIDIKEDSDKDAHQYERATEHK